MAKIMLVEDDNNLREIYGARLIAEGHEIVSAQDGEEALALAVKEKPDLIISDIMMPRISGFDMLDILRNAPETKNAKVIMMTALSQAEDKARADKLGADKYLVKSQATLEDVVKAVKDVLGQGQGNEAVAAPANEINAPASTTETTPSIPKSAEQVSPEPESTLPPSPSATSQPVPDSPIAQTVPVVTPPDPATTPQTDDNSQTTSQDDSAPASQDDSQQTDDSGQQSDEDSSPENTITTAVNTKPADPTVSADAPKDPEISSTPDQQSRLAQQTPVASGTVSIPVTAPDDDPGNTSQAAQTEEDPSATTKETPANPVSAAPDETESGAEPQSFKVELPTPPNEVQKIEDQDEQPVENQATNVDTETTVSDSSVGPSVEEALAQEEQATTATTGPSTNDQATPDTPIVANGASVSGVIEPTVPNEQSSSPQPLEPAAEKTEEESQSSTEIDSNNPNKRVIQPLNDPFKKPDLEALLAAEEQKAAVQNPSSGAVITPVSVEETAPDSRPSPAHDPNDPDNIAI